MILMVNSLYKEMKWFQVLIYGKTNINLCSLISMVFDLMWQEYSTPNSYEINKFLLILYSGLDETIINSVGVEDMSTDKITPEEKEKMTDDQKTKLVEAEEDFKEETDAIDVEGKLSIDRKTSTAIIEVTNEQTT